MLQPNFVTFPGIIVFVELGRRCGSCRICRSAVLDDSKPRFMDRRTKTAEQKFLTLISGSPKSLGSRFMCRILWVTSWGYRCGTGFRNLLFDLGIKLSHAAPVPVISVGNLTTGGTGKTPTVALLVGMLQKLGHQPGLISRGYRELSEGGNDEARVLALLCPGIPHVQNRDRVAAAHEVAADDGCTVIIADDAFQHRRLKRDLDIVLIDALNPWGHDALLPRGLLREPVSGLRRADIVILTRADLIDEASRTAIWKIVGWNNQTAVNVEVSFVPTGLVDATGAQTAIVELTAEHNSAADSNADSVTLAFCGIGNPDGFRKTLKAAEVSILELVGFPDHHHYDQSDIQKLTATAEKLKANALITTLKDLVKIEPGWISSVGIVALSIEARVTSGKESLVTAISKLMPPPNR